MPVRTTGPEEIHQLTCPGQGGALDHGPILIVGASGRAAAQSARRAGVKVGVADLFGDVDLRQCASFHPLPVGRYPAEIARLVRNLSSHYAAAAYVGAIENYPEIVDEMSANLPLLGNPADTLRVVRDPERFATEFAARHWPTARITLNRPPAVADGGRWLCKPFRSAGGNGIQFTHDSNTDKVRSDVYYQQFIPGIGYSGSYVANGSRCRLLGVCQQLAGRNKSSHRDAAPFRYVGSIGPLSMPPDFQMAWQQLGQSATEAFQLRGVFGIDTIVTEQQTIIPLEVNPRFTASMELIDRGCDISCFGTHVAACTTGELPGATIIATSLWEKQIVYARRAFRVSERCLATLLNGDRDWCYADIPPAESTIRAGQPITTRLRLVNRDT
ncbi:MAG: ATP-grasp domain-containing protein [Planctomycetales bacterium]|nr:ATP-grasp domain-containing protein [Planctomycetales bacterium]